MSTSTFQKKTSQIILAAIIGVVVFSFVFDSFINGLRGDPQTVATVGNQQITVREFQSAYQGFLEQKGQKDSPELRQQVLQELAQQKYMMILSEHFQEKISSKELKNSIEKFFKEKVGEKDKNFQFNLDVYKRVLAGSNFTPQDFEESFTKDLLTQKISSLITFHPLSVGLKKELEELDKNKIEASVVKIFKNNLINLVKVDKQEVENFLKDPSNKAKVQASFEQKKSSFMAPEKRKVEAILFNKGTTQEIKEKLKSSLTAENFLAKKKEYSKYLSQDLEPFLQSPITAESMNISPIFETFLQAPKGELKGPLDYEESSLFFLVTEIIPEKKPIYEEHESKIAQEFVAKTKLAEREEILKTVVEKTKTLLLGKKDQELETLKESYGATVSLNGPLSLLSNRVGLVELDSNQIFTFFSRSLEEVQIEEIKDESSVTLVAFKKIGQQAQKSSSEKDLEKENLQKSLMGDSDSLVLEDIYRREFMEAFLSKGPIASLQYEIRDQFRRSFTDFMGKNNKLKIRPDILK